MVWTRRFWLKLHSLCRRSHAAQQLSDEIQFHLDQQIGENLAAGMSLVEARYAAMRLFGNATALKEETRDAWGWITLEQIAQDLRYGFRSLRKSPLFAAVAVLTLAFGIGANTAIFNLMDQVLLELLPVKHPEQLVLVAERGICFGDSWGDNDISYPMYRDFRDGNQVFSGMFCRYPTSVTRICKGEGTMKKDGGFTKAILFATLLATISAGASSAVRSQGNAASYPNMAPLDKYLMTDRNSEIAVARSAAPPSISADAEVLVLGRHGYETAVTGKNGFVCLVERSWMSAFDFAQFWNPKMRGPICFNPPAVRSILPLTLKRTELVLAGLSKAQIIEGIKAFDAKGLPPLEPGAMSFMMSPQGYLNDEAGHWVPHLMFYIPLTGSRSWGADLSGSPVMLNPQFNGAPEPITEFMVPVPTWSDGTAAPKEGQ